MTAHQRLFVGIPVEPQVGSAIHTWATQSYASESVRVLTPTDLHVTLMFFPSVTLAGRERMIELVRQIVWKPVLASSGPTVRLGRNALAIMLELSSGDLNELDRRMLLCSVTPQGGQDLSSALATYDRLRAEPLGQLSLEQNQADWERRRRRLDRGLPLSLHVTFARTRADLVGAVPLHRFPTTTLGLNSLALYESHLRPEGSEYELLARAVSNS